MTTSQAEGGSPEPKRAADEVSPGALSALIGYVHACEQTLLADQLAASERDAAGTPQDWSARAILAHDADFRREQAIRLLHVAAGTEPPPFPQVDHRDPDVYRGYKERSWDAVQADLATVVADLVTGLHAVGAADLTDSGRFPWLCGRQLWAQVLVRGAWHPVGHLSGYLVARGRAEHAISVTDGVLRAARALRIPEAPGGTAMAVYVLACVRARTGDRDAALALLRAALADDPALAANAAGDPDLEALRADPEFPVPMTA